MPYMLEKNDKGETCVWTKGADGRPTGPTHGCHPTPEEAQKQMDALYANVPDAGGGNADASDYSPFDMTRADILAAPSDDAQLAQALETINAQHARSPLKPEDIYIFPAAMSNQNLDSFHTRMTDGTLANYAQDAIRGVPLMNSHRTKGAGMMQAANAELPHGRSFAATLTGEAGARTLNVWHYVLRDWEMNGVQSNHLIRGIEGGVIHDMSIGFKAGRYGCSICGKNAANMEECRHLPGATYDGVRAFAWVENGHLFEDSMVYKGATPNAAVIRKAQEALALGYASPAQIRELEDAYEVRIMPTRAFSIDRLPPKGPAGEVTDMEFAEIRAAFQGIESVAETTDLAGLATAVMTRIEAADAAAADAGKKLDTATARIAELDPLAVLGKAYKADLTEEAVAARVRVQGVDFDATTYRSMLAGLTPDAIKAEIESHTKQARKQFTPGRPTQAAHPDNGQPVQKPAIPDEMYRA